MAKLHHVKKAAKDNPACGIKKGQEYWFQWKRTSQKVRAKRTIYLTKPKPSQLASSAFMAEVLAIEEGLEGCDSLDTIREAADAIRDVGEDCQTKADYMPNNLRNSPTVELLLERAMRCEEIATELENVADAVECTEPLEGEEVTIESQLANVSWDFP